MKKPCSNCSRAVFVHKDSKTANPTCHPCRRIRREAEQLAAQKYCAICDAPTSRKFCDAHKRHDQCFTCGQWARNRNAYRKSETRRFFCTSDCRIAAGVAANGQVVGVSSPIDWRQCNCGTWICAPGQGYCSEACKNPPRTCPDCPTPIAKGRQRCDPCRDKRETERKRAAKKNPEHRRLNKYRKRAKHYGVPYVPINRRKVFVDDDWICGICKELVDKDLKYPDLMSASLDHIIPMSRGGGHVPDNVQCAHFLCNSVKSNRLEEELVA